jgi:hypothetical protein
MVLPLGDHQTDDPAEPCSGYVVEWFKNCTPRDDPRRIFYVVGIGVCWKVSVEIVCRAGHWRRLSVMSATTRVRLRSKFRNYYAKGSIPKHGRGPAPVRGESPAPLKLEPTL